MADIQINFKEVQKLLKNLTPPWAIGPDAIPSCLGKTVADQHVPILTEVNKHPSTSEMSLKIVNMHM